MLRRCGMPRLRVNSVCLAVAFFGLVPVACRRQTKQPPAAPTKTAAGSKVDATAQRDTHLTSVLVREGDVFAANAVGLYRASRTEKRWRHLPTPGELPPSGAFGRVPGSSEAILYYVPRSRAWKIPDKESKRFGLYASEDTGETWSLLSDEHDFRDVFLHDDGTVYAIVETRYPFPVRQPGYTTGIPWSTTDASGRKIAIRQRILRSGDTGRTWEDITGTIGPGVELLGIFADPDHPDLICLNANCIRGLVLQAADADYEWKTSVVWNWRERHMTDEMFFGRSQTGGGSPFYRLRATLDNYFAHSFRDRVEINPFDIVTGRSTYVFSKGQSKHVEVAVHFYCEQPDLVFKDLTTSLDRWGIRVKTPAGKREGVYPLAGTNRGKPREEYLASDEIVSWRLTRERPYRRSLDLAALYDFQAAGTYRVQLRYNGYRVADFNKKEFSGGFAGNVFEVRVSGD